MHYVPFQDISQTRRTNTGLLRSPVTPLTCSPFRRSPLAGQWPVAAGLVVAERTGRAIRKPVVEAMLSHAGRSIGAGWVFGLNEALDQAGATIGPLLIALILFL